MQGFQFGYGDPLKFADWAQYAGLDRKTGQFMPKQPSAGVPPPENLSDFAKQQLAPIQDKFTNVAKTFGQVSQGNFSGALGSMGLPTSFGGPAAPAAGATVGTEESSMLYDFVKMIGQ